MDPKTIVQQSNQAFDTIENCKQSMADELQWLIDETPSDKAKILYGEALVYLQAVDQKVIKGFVKHDAQVENILQQSETASTSSRSGYRKPLVAENNRTNQYRSTQRKRTSQGTFAAQQ